MIRAILVFLLVLVVATGLGIAEAMTESRRARHYLWALGFLLLILLGVAL